MWFFFFMWRRTRRKYGALVLLHHSNKLFGTPLKFVLGAQCPFFPHGTALRAMFD